jgi:hypothetical protein
MEDAEPFGRSLESPRSPFCEKRDGERLGRFKRKGDAFFYVQKEREPARWLSPREHSLRPELIPQGAKKERSYRVGHKPSKRGFNTEVGLNESARAEEERGDLFFDRPVEESSEGEIPGAWGAERGFLGIEGRKPSRG